MSAAMTSRQLIRWDKQHSHAAREPVRQRWSTLALTVAGTAWVARGGSLPSQSTRALVWLALLLVIAMFRTATHLWWRPNAALLLRLPLANQALVDVGWARCVRDAAAYALAATCVTAPLLQQSFGAWVAHLAVASACALVIAALAPAWTLLAGMLVVRPWPAALAQPSPSAAAPIIGGVPGFGSALVLLLLLALAPSLANAPALLSWQLGASALGAIAIAAGLGTRRLAAQHMRAMLRQALALDQLRLATLEIHPPGPVHRRLMRHLAARPALLLGKNARLMSRRYPMAGVLGFLALATQLINAATAGSATVMWLALAGASAYSIALARALGGAPVRLDRSERALGISSQAAQRAAAVWVVVWWVVWVCVPATIAAWHLGQPALGVFALGAVALPVGVTALPTPADHAHRKG